VLPIRALLVAKAVKEESVDDDVDVDALRRYIAADSLAVDRARLRQLPI
jgi:hypothetical protein